MSVVVGIPTPPPKQKPKRKRKARKKKEVPKMGAFMDPTQDFFKREGFIKRRTAWMWRMTPFIRKLNEAQCGSCQMNGRCNRVPLDEKITAKIAAGKGCPDHKSMWKSILGGEEEEYDWGF